MKIKDFVGKKTNMYKKKVYLKKKIIKIFDEEKNY